jgi:hypothetical protein
MATLSQAETSTQPAWIMAIMATARIIVVIVGIGRFRMACGVPAASRSRARIARPRPESGVKDRRNSG